MKAKVIKKILEEFDDEQELINFQVGPDVTTDYSRTVTVSYTREINSFGELLD